MEIKIHKENGVSQILLDGKPIQSGCMGFKISSEGSGSFTMIELKFATKDLDFSAEIDDPILQNQIASRFRPNPK